MIGLDTNVLLRLFVEDDPAQSDRARRFVDAAAADEPCVVNPVVLAEFAWTLARNFKKKRPEVARLIEGVLSMDDLEVPFRHAALGALAAYHEPPDYRPESRFIDVRSPSSAEAGRAEGGRYPLVHQVGASGGEFMLALAVSTKCYAASRRQIRSPPCCKDSSVPDAGGSRRGGRDEAALKGR